MAGIIFKDIDIDFGGTDLSGFGRGLTMVEGATMHESQAYGDDWEWFTTGLRKGAVTIQFWQSFAVGETDATIRAVLGTTAVIVIKPTSGAVSTANPSFTFTAGIENYERFAGNIGDKGIASVDLVLAANTGIVVATA